MEMEAETPGWLFAALGHAEAVWLLPCGSFCCFFPSAELLRTLLNS